MKIKILSVLLIVILFSCVDENDSVSSLSSDSGTTTFASSEKTNKPKHTATFRSTLDACSQTASYTAQLQTLAGTHISPSAVSANTDYKIVITYSGTYPGSTNVAYAVVSAVGASTCDASDATSGNAVVFITTDATIPGFGIFVVVGPTDCTGSCVSAQGSVSSWVAAS